MRLNNAVNEQMNVMYQIHWTTVLALFLNLYSTLNLLASTINIIYFWTIDHLIFIVRFG